MPGEPDHADRQARLQHRAALRDPGQGQSAPRGLLAERPPEDHHQREDHEERRPGRPGRRQRRFRAERHVRPDSEQRDEQRDQQREGVERRRRAPAKQRPAPVLEPAQPSGERGDGHGGDQRPVGIQAELARGTEERDEVGAPGERERERVEAGHRVCAHELSESGEHELEFLLARLTPIRARYCIRLASAGLAEPSPARRSSADEAGIRTPHDRARGGSWLTIATGFSMTPHTTPEAACLRFLVARSLAVGVGMLSRREPETPPAGPRPAPAFGAGRILPTFSPVFPA